jgi:hypothetical protein
MKNKGAPMDFLIFDSFISIPVLIGFYMVGAVLCPFVMWRCLGCMFTKFSLVEITYLHGFFFICELLPVKQKVKVLLLFIAAFLLAEIFWRMLFEFLIGYMQMHDALVY